MAKTLASVLLSIGFAAGISLASEIEMHKYLEIAAYGALVIFPVVSVIISSDKGNFRELEIYYKNIQNRKH